MAPYDSDSSDGDTEDYTTTATLLGYASTDPTDDSISQLGGRPAWIDPAQPPSAALARCKTCNDLMPLLLQLYSSLPEYFPGHERRLHVFGCRRRTCRRKEGSVRAVRSVRISAGAQAAGTRKAQVHVPAAQAPVSIPSRTLGNSIFGATSSSGNLNPFSGPVLGNSNPFSSPSPALPSTIQSAFTPSIVEAPTESFSNLPTTFAEKLRLSSPPAPAEPSSTPEPWPSETELPSPYPSYYLDSDYEALDKPDPVAVSQPSIMDVDEANPVGPSSAKEDADTYESTIDKTFQRFADRLAQNPLQILRYEFRGSPLLYSKVDPVGKLLAPDDHHSSSQALPGSGRNGQYLTTQKAGGSGIRVPACGRCGTGRVFELQLTPQAIAELEVDEIGLEGMEWGSVVVGVCGADCGGEPGNIVYAEEWVGVQWEEMGKP